MKRESSRIRLHYSNRSECILDALVANLERERHLAGANLFEPTAIVVPNRNVETWLKFGIARSLGIAANLEVSLLRRFVAGVIGAALPSTRVLDTPSLEGLLLALLHDEQALAHPDLAQVREYLLAAGDARDVVDMRRTQLAARLARLFEEYDYSRPDMLAAWPERAVIEHSNYRETERWQRQLWLEVCGPQGLAARRSQESGQSWVTVSRLFETLDPAVLSLPPTLHIFGVSYLARVFMKAFSTIARATELHVYTLNPCMEFWEDLATDGERSKRRWPRRTQRVTAAQTLESDDPYQLLDEGDTPLLRMWGRPGRENIRLLNELTDCDFDACFIEPTAPASLLATLQGDILRRAPERTTPDGSFATDESITNLACPSVRREAEVITREIWSLLRADSAAGGAAPLRMNEIAVIVPGARRDLYLTHLSSVMREMHELPHNVVDLPLHSESHLVEGVELLLGLPFGRFTRQEILGVATHPSVIARYPEADPTEWAAWCETLGIVHGGDHSDHDGTYIEHDVLNWDQGLRRMALGSFMTGRRSGDAHHLASGGEEYLPEELRQDGILRAGELSSLVRSLIADARYLREVRLPLREWIPRLHALIDTYITADSDEDRRALSRCRGAIQGLEECPLGDVAVSYRIPCELVKSALASLTAGRGQSQADGVVVSALVPMRALPFRVIFVAGLGEGQFPSQERKDALDLRGARRRAGDVNPREQDKYLFLETLLCARDRLYLSYVARDELTGDRCAPSSVVRELEHVLERGYLGKGRFARRTPYLLRRHDEESPASPIDPPRYGQTAQREASAQKIGERLRAHLGDAPKPRTLLELRASVDDPAWRALAAPLGIYSVAGSTAQGEDVETVRLSMSVLRRFLECPMQGSAQAVVGLRDEDEDDLAAREDELFETPMLSRLMLLRGVFLDGVRRRGERGARTVRQLLSDCLADASRLLERDGKLPTGPFLAAQVNLHVDILCAWWAESGALAVGMPSLAIHRFGRAEEHAVAETLRNPVVLDGVQLPGGRRARVEIHGRTEALLDGKTSLVQVIRSARSIGKARYQRDALRGFLDHLMLTASGEPPVERRVRVCTYDRTLRGGMCHEEAFSAVSSEGARECLALLASELLGDVHDYLLPCEAVFNLQLDAGDARFARHVDDLVENDRGLFSSDYGPVPQPRTYSPPSETRAREMIARRFGLYWNIRRLVDGDVSVGVEASA